MIEIAVFRLAIQPSFGDAVIRVLGTRGGTGGFKWGLNVLNPPPVIPKYVDVCCYYVRASIRKDWILSMTRSNAIVGLRSHNVSLRGAVIFNSVANNLRK